MARRPARHAPRGPDGLRGARDARGRLLGGQPHLLLPLHLDARPRGRRDPRGRPRQRRRTARHRRPDRPTGRASPPPRCAGPTRGSGSSTAPTSTPPRRPPRGAALQDRVHPGRDAPRRRRPGQRRVRGPARDRARPGRLDHPPGRPARWPTSTPRRVVSPRPRRPPSRAMPARTTGDERWIDLSLRTVLARIALEQGRIAEAVAGTRAVVVEARELAEDRVGLLAETLLRNLDPTWVPTDVVRETLPWAVRLPVLAQDGRDLLARGDVEARSRTGRRRGRPGRLRAPGPRRASTPACCSAARWSTSATSTRPRRPTSPPSTTAAPCACRCAPPTCSTGSPGSRASATCSEARSLAAAAFALRTPRKAARWGYSADYDVVPAARAPEEWLDGDDLSADVGRRSSRPSSTGPRPHDRRCSTRSRPPSARSPSGWRTG